MSFKPELIRSYEIIQSKKIPFKYLKITPGGVVSMFDIIDDSIQKGKDLDQIMKENPEYTYRDIIMLYYDHFIDSNKDIDEIINKIKQFQSLQKMEEFEISPSYQDWVREYQIQSGKDVLVATKILNLINTIQNVDISTFKLSPIKYNYVNRISHPKIKVPTATGFELVIPNIDDGLELFNIAIPSYEIPFIQYNKTCNDLNGEYNLDLGNRYKIYKGESSNPVPLEFTILSKNDTKDLNTLYFTVWTGKNLNKLIKEYYISAEYNLLKNELTFAVPLKDAETANLIIYRLEKCLGIVIDPMDIADLNLSAEFMIYPTKNQYVYHDIFAYAIINNNIYNNFIYIDEKDKPLAIKKVKRLRYKALNKQLTEFNENNVSAWITFHNIEPEIPEVLPLASGDSITIESGEQYIRVLIVKAQDMDIVDEIYYNFTRLIKYYLDNKITYIQELQEYFDIINEKIKLDETTKVEQKSKKKRSDRNIFILKDIGQGLIGNKYARICQCKQQPKIINQSEVAEWSQKKFIHGDFELSQQVLPFPPDNPKWWFVCTSKNYPFPGVKINTDEDIALFPYVPCCFKKNQAIKGTGKPFDIYYFGGTPKEKKSKTSNVLASTKSLENNRFGNLPEMVIKLLQKYDESEDITFYRFGVINSPNSLLHCVFQALGNKAPEYSALQTDQEKENYVRMYRQKIFSNNRYSIDVMKQELYDHNDDEIRELISNPDVFLNPSLYYRFIEEMFGFNIYVLSTPKDNEETFAMLETPRHKFFHTRRFRENRPTLVIFKHWGSESNRLNIPHCELVISVNNDSRTIYELYFRPEMGELLHDVIIKTKNTISWSIDPLNFKVTARKNLYNSLNSYNILSKKNKILSQLLDGYGKVRAFVLEASTNKIMVVVPPAQPENLPVITRPEERSDLNTVYSLFGNNPSLVSINTKGDIDGLWYTVLDLDEGFYIPIKEIPRASLSNVAIGSNNPLFTDNKNMVKRLKDLNRINKIILQLVLWLYLHSDMELVDFIESAFVVDSRKVINSEKYYNIRNVTRRLPVVNTYEEAFSYLELVVPSLVKNGKIILYSKKYAEGVIYFLKEYIESTDIINEPIPKYIKVILEDESDFKQFANTVIFTRENDMKTWLLNQTKLGIKPSTIYRRIDFSDNLTQEPIIYQEPSGKTYIIQNVYNSEYSRAINVAFNWYSLLQNLGFDAPKYEKDIFPHHVIYGITANNILGPIKDTRDNTGAVKDENEYFLQIVKYGEDKYGAMLPL